MVESMVLGRIICSAVLVLGWSGAAMRAQDTAVTAPQTATGETPLPELHALIMALDKNQKAAEAAAENYTYHLHQVTEPRDGKGNLKKTATVDSESLTVQGVRVDRTVARDGKPLTPDEAKKESERIDKEVAKAKERRA